MSARNLTATQTASAWSPAVFFASYALVCLLLASCLGSRVQAEEPSKGADDEHVKVEFETQVWPILQRRCLKCHGSYKCDGGLRLDSRAWAEQGGHTGNTLLAATPEESELYQRIISEDDDYRMPADSNPLPAAEIKLIKTWLSEGANWPEQRYAAGTSSLTGNAKRYYERFLDPLKREYERNRKYLVFLGFPLAAYLIFVVVCERARSARTERVSRLASYPRAWHIIVLLGFSLAGVWLYFHAALVDSESRIARLNRENARLRGEQPADWQTRNEVPTPPPRRHPKRLGGVYYRGNDERDARLFNGGFYRTATISVWLTDAEGNRLAWNDPVSHKALFLSVEITRAAKATSALFRPGVMKLIFLSRQVPDSESEEFKDSPIQFIPVEEGESWIAQYPLASAAASPDGTLAGMLYLYQGKLDGQRITGKIHYGIEYDVKISDGLISADSQIWMGSIFNPAGKLLIPAENRIVLDEWFDFRPIPEIEGENSTDPMLLGIPAHDSDDK